MQPTSVNVELRQAHHLIQAGKRAAARKILTPIVNAYPNIADAWWLLAHSLDDIEQIHRAMFRVLELAPNYPGAAEKWEIINIERRYNDDRSSRQYGWWWFFAILAVILVIGASLTVAVLVVNNLQDTISDDSQVAYIVETADAEELAKYSADGLPPQISTDGFSGSLPTPNPSQFGDTYWDGSDGVSMDYYELDGRYRRFYKFPIKLYIDGANTPEWQDAVNHSIQQINQVVPMVQTTSRGEADIVLEFRRPSEVQAAMCGVKFYSYCRVCFD